MMNRALLVVVLGGLLAAGCSGPSKVAEPVAAGGARTALPAGDGEPTKEPGVLPTTAASDSAVGSSTNGSDQKYLALSNALRAGTPTQVQNEAAKILLGNPNDIVVINALAMWNYRQGKVGAAKLLLARAIEKGEPRASVLNNYGLMLLSEGDDLAASEQFKKAIRLDERHAEANANLGAHYAKGGDWKRALPRLEAAWIGGRQESSVANNYALALKAEGEPEKARKIFEEALKRNNKDTTLMLNYAALLIEVLNRPKEGLPLVYRVKFLETDKKDVLTRANQLERKASGTTTP